MECGMFVNELISHLRALANTMGVSLLKSLS